MYYKHKPDHRYKLISITNGYSKSTKSKGRPMKTIVFHNLDLNKSLETYVVVTGQHQNGSWVDGFANERHWETIIKSFDIAKDYIITFNEKMTDQYGKPKDFKVKLKKEKDGVKYILDADSHPETDMELLSTFEPVEQEVREEPVKQFDNPLFEI
jgi:hypothetical protein